jgi:hypothetical protein
MATFDRATFIQALAKSMAFTEAQVDALVGALEASLGGAVVPGESHEAPPLRGAGIELR